ncbi:PHP domain-containing protein [Fimbriiglobus ruber]|uniref:Metal-dependent phosphoesterase (PHP family) n=1 Tax=Fimbriiglobus ruber TaxID=1908690 RepID=A0A225DRB4_9BACT|nr:PHP domain-containing protein [Fimbriiglobus ruber]OWK43831.1 metal-dependent phosphoesterase (PHP family) [Fimbriiglobus ruber]
MPRGQPFTALCQAIAAHARPIVADLHLHTTASDGEYTPSQVVALAVREGLSAVAVTDHDTLGGLAAAESAAAAFGRGLQVIAGVECSAEFEGREVHILGYHVCPTDTRLLDALEVACARRRKRFQAYLTHLATSGVVLPSGLADTVIAGAVSVGRRHLAGLLVRCGVARSRYDAFRRFLEPSANAVPRTHLIPAADAIRLIRGAGGVASLAHPPAEITETHLGLLRDLGLQAVEVAFPAATAGHAGRLRALAAALGLAVTGGSDCHGPEPTGRVRTIGSKGVTRDELDALRQLSGHSAST